MNLINLKAFVDAHADIEAEDREIFFAQSAKCRGVMEEYFPSYLFSPDQQASIAWFLAEVTAGIRQLSIAQANDVLADTAHGYGIAAAQILGLMDKE